MLPNRLEQKWPLLEKGDIVDIVAPDLKEAVKLARVMKGFKQAGLVPRVDRSFFHVDKDIMVKSYESDVRKAILTNDSKAVFFIVGSVATQNILNAIISSTENDVPAKFCIGNLNLTSIYSAISKKWSWLSLYVSHIDCTNQKIDIISSIMSGAKSDLTFNDLVPVNSLAHSSMIISGEVCGGNLRKIVDSLENSWIIDSKDKIIYIEESVERASEILIMMSELNHSGWFNQAKAVVFGNINFGETSEVKTMQIIDRISAKLKIPVVRFSEKTNKNNIPMLIGAEAHLTLGSKAKLKFELHNKISSPANDLFTESHINHSG